MDEAIKQAGDLVQSFMAISKLLTKFTQENAASLGLTLPQMGILNTVYTSANITLKEVTVRLQLPKSTASIAVDDLFNMGLIERKTADDDRREINLKATEKGEEVARKSCANASSYRAMQSALTHFNQDDIQTLARIHKDLMGYLTT